MIRDLPRRAALFLPLLLAACGDDDEPPPPARRDFPPLRYDFLRPIDLNVQRMESAGEFVPAAGEDEVSGLCPINMGETLYAMARDRLKPVGTDGIATFKILTASITRHRDTLNGVLAVRLDVHNGDNTSSGYAEARVTRKASGPMPDLPAAIYDLFKAMMFDMNVELEYQVRNKIRTWVVDTPPGAPAVAPAQPVDPSAPIPPPPPAPPPVPPPVPPKP